MARIEVREFELGVNEHALVAMQYLVYYNDKGQRQELKAIPIPNQVLLGANGVMRGDGIKVVAYPPHEDFPDLTYNQVNGVYDEDQSSRILFEGSESEVYARWEKALDAAQYINEMNYQYIAGGGNATNIEVGNSNSVTAALECIMGATPSRISKLPVPGLYKNLLPDPNGENLFELDWELGNNYIPNNDDAMAALGLDVINIVAEPSNGCLIS